MVFLLATPSGTGRQVNGKKIWQVMSVQFWKSVDINWVLETSPIPCLFLSYFLHGFKQDPMHSSALSFVSLANIVYAGCGYCFESCVCFLICSFFFFFKLLSPIQEL